MEQIDITVLVTTCDRYDTTLPLCLLSVINQSKKPKKIILVDDSKIKKFYSHTILLNILTLCKHKNIDFEYFYGESKGMVPAIKLGLDKITDGWVYKIDDDNVLEYNVLQLLTDTIHDGVGAVGGVFIDENTDHEKLKSERFNLLEDIFFEINIQMKPNQSNEVKEVEHLYSNYFFRKNIEENHPNNLQPSGHREDTIFTHSIFRKGYKLLVNPSAIIYHLNVDNLDGNRKFRGNEENKNELIFIDKLKEWEIIPNKLDILCKNGLIIFNKGKYQFNTQIKC